MIFVDTGAWLNLFDERQELLQRQKAIAFLASIDEPVCTSDLIIAETHKWLIHHGRPATKALAVLRRLVTQEATAIIPVEQDDSLAALQLVRKYADLKLSYEDAVTVALATRYGIRKIFSYDKHFLIFPSIERVP